MFKYNEETFNMKIIKSLYKNNQSLCFITLIILLHLMVSLYTSRLCTPFFIFNHYFLENEKKIVHSF